MKRKVKKLFLNNSIHEDIRHYVELFLDGRKNNGRNLSFDHCYTFFQTNYLLKDEEKRNNMALHLYAYLASWGMLRNSFLLYKDYTYLVGLIEILESSKKAKYTITDIISFKEQIISHFKGTKEKPTQYMTVKGGPQYVCKRKNWDTLTSKILMGTLGCVPAYDDYFRGVASKVFGISQSFNEASLKCLFDFKEKYSNDIKEMQKITEEKCGFTYPEMKIVDMYFWQKGYSEGISANPSRAKQLHKTKYKRKTVHSKDKTSFPRI